MTTQARTERGILAVLVELVRWSIGLFERIPYSVIALGARIFPAAVFWYSGRTKVEGWPWQLRDAAIALFEDEYQVPLLDPTFAAYLTAFAEHLFPILLVLGLATRYSALALLFMTAVIQLFVFPGAWPTHGVWATCFLILIARGGGAISLDHWIGRRFGRSG